MTALARRACFCVIAIAVTFPLFSANAQHHDGHASHAGPEGHAWGHRGNDFHGRSYRSFSPYERRIWDRGHWVNEWHDGRLAWWWVVNDGWYLSPEPFPPNPVYAPPAIVVEQAPPQPIGLPPPQSWYYCDNPLGYYPYVASCLLPWREVPAQPPK